MLQAQKKVISSLQSSTHGFQLFYRHHHTGQIGKGAWQRTLGVFYALGLQMDHSSPLFKMLWIKFHYIGMPNCKEDWDWVQKKGENRS